MSGHSFRLGGGNQREGGGQFFVRVVLRSYSKGEYGCGRMNDGESGSFLDIWYGNSG